MQDHSKKFSVRRSNSVTFMFSPKCAPDDPLVLQAHLQVVREIVNDTNTFLYGDCPDLGCDCCLQVTDCLGVVFVHSVLQITPKVKIWGV